MNHSFDIDHAARFGTNEAILIECIAFWVRTNKANGTGEFEGRTWTYNSVRAYAVMFPYMSAGQVRRALEHLVELNVLMVGEFNAKAGDRTKSYAFVDDRPFQPEVDHLSLAANGPETPETDHLSLATNGPETPETDHLSPAANGADHLSLVPTPFVTSDKSLISTVVNTVNPAVKPKKAPPAAPDLAPGEPLWSRTDESIMARGVELGVAPLVGESMTAFKNRIQAKTDPVKAKPARANVAVSASVQSRAPLPRPAVPTPEVIAARRRALDHALHGQQGRLH